MTNKQRILQMVERWPADISYEKAVYHMWVLKKIDAGLRDIEAGRVFEDDEVMDELERRCDEEENQGSVVSGSSGRPSPIAHEGHGGRSAENGKIVRKPAKKARKPATS